MMDNSDLRNVAMRFSDEILPPYNKLVCMDSFDFVCAFCDVLSGSCIYVPSVRTVFRGCIEKSAKEEYNGRNVRELMRKYGYSESQFRKILGKIGQ